jgi:hypothetical protein
MDPIFVNAACTEGEGPEVMNYGLNLIIDQGGPTKDQRFSSWNRVTCDLIRWDDHEIPIGRSVGL